MNIAPKKGICFVMYSRLSSLNSRPNTPCIINSRKSETSEFEAHITLSFESINVLIWFGIRLHDQAFKLHIFKAYRTFDDILLRIVYIWLDMYSAIDVYSKTIDTMVA